MTIDAMHRIWAEQDGKWWIGSNCVHMGYCGEHESYMLCFALEDLAYSGWAFKLDTSIGDGATLDMDTAAQDSMLIISYEVDRSAVSLPGEFEACIRALGPDGEVKKSNIFMISVADTVLAGGELPPAPPSEWEQLERRINEAKNQAIQAADDAEAAEAEAKRISDDFVTETVPKAIEQIEQAGSDQAAIVIAEGDKQVKRVADAGAAQVSAINTAADTRKAEIEEAGAQAVADAKAQADRAAEEADSAAASATEAADSAADAESAEQRVSTVLQNYPTRREADNRYAHALKGTATGDGEVAMTDAQVGTDIKLALQGAGAQKAYVATGGISTQDGTPTPDTPVAIAPAYAAGTYQIKTYAGLYEVDIPDLHGLGDVRDTVTLDVPGNAAWITKRCATATLNGTESPWIYQANTYFKLDDALPIGGTGILCDCYAADSYSNVSNGVGDKTIATYYNASFTRVAILDKAYTTAADFKAHLAEQPATILYQSAAPTVTRLNLRAVQSSTAPELPAEYIDITPSPDLPIMPTWSGGELKVHGRNLWPDFITTTTYPNGTTVKLNTDGSIDIHKVAGQNLSQNIIYHAKAGTYTLWNGTSAGSKVYLQLGGYATLSYPSISFTLSGGDYSLYLYSDPDIELDITLRPMLIEGTYTLDTMPEYRPYTMQSATLPTLRGIRNNSGWAARDELVIGADGSVQALRRIKELELTGEEMWFAHSHAGYGIVSNYRMHAPDCLDTGAGGAVVAEAHPVVSNIAPYGGYCGRLINQSVGNSGDTYIYFRWDGEKQFPTVDDWKAYLAAQYAAGTPVTVWYELAEPVTETLPAVDPLSIQDSATAITATGLPPTITADYKRDINIVLMDQAAYNLELDARITQLQLLGGNT